MPWDHCDVEFILDDEPCPSCGVAKAQWTVELDRTRHLRIGRRVGPGPARWSQRTARVGDVVELRVEAPGLPEDAAATLRILEHDADGAHDFVADVEGRVKGGTLRACWACEDVGDDDDWAARAEDGRGYWLPEYFFEVDLPGGTARSGAGEELLRLLDDVVVVLVDAWDRPLPGRQASVRGPHGAEGGGVVGEDGLAPPFEAVPPGPLRFAVEEEPWPQVL